MNAAKFSLFQGSVPVPPPVGMLVVALTQVFALAQKITSAVQKSIAGMGAAASAHGPTSVQGLQSLVSPLLRIYSREC